MTTRAMHKLSYPQFLDADFFYNLLKSVNVTLCPLHPLEAGKIEGLSHFRGISPLGRGWIFKFI